MSVEFDNEPLSQQTQYMSRTILGERTLPKMSKMLIQAGITKNPSTAQKILLATAILFIFVTIGIFTYFILDINPFSAESKKTANPQRFELQNK
jgi:hypothetical protein